MRIRTLECTWLVFTAIAVLMAQGSLIVHYDCEEENSPLTDAVGSQTAEADGTNCLYQQIGVPAGTYGAIVLGISSGYAVGLPAGSINSWNLDATESLELGSLVNNFTVMMWVFVPVGGIGDDWPRMIAENVNGGDGWGMSIRNKAGNLNSISLIGNGVAGYYSVNATVTNGGWQHIAATKSSTDGVKFYHNGQLVSGYADYSGATNNFISTLDIYGLGEGNNGGVDTTIEGMLMDEVRVYDTVLDAGGIVEAAKVAVSAVVWTDRATTNITANSAWAKAVVDTGLTNVVLVWENTTTSVDPGTGSTNDWTYRLSLGSQSLGVVTGQMTSLDADTEYVWRFYGTTATTNGWSALSTFATGLTDARKPVFTDAVTLSHKSIRLDWQDNASNETAYVLRRSDAFLGPYVTIATLPANTTSYTNTQLTFSSTYYYQLAATNTVNNSGTTPSLCQTNGTTSGALPVMVISAASLPTPDYDLTDVYGIGDWAYWADTDDPAASGDPSNERLGADLIGSMSVVGTGVLRGSTGDAPVHDLVFTNGTSPVSGRTDDIRGLFSDNMSVEGEGVQVTVTSPSFTPYYIYVWAASYHAFGRLTATVNGHSDYDDTLNDPLRAPGRFYTIRIDPEAIGDSVAIQLVVDATDGTFSHVLISAVAVGVGEPPSGTVISIM